jgi:hypothetical protein
MYRKRTNLVSILGWGLVLVAVAYVWLFALVSVLAVS